MIYGGNPEALPLTIDQIKSLDYDKILETYKSRFADMATSPSSSSVTSSSTPSSPL